MTVLVDDATWSWRGERWAHLASDASVDELHDFAASLGLRRLAFQGDHYDVPSPLRARAVDLGAEAVGSRELVRRLRAAGLRRSGRAPLPKWDRVLVADPGAYPSPAALEAALVRVLGAPAMTQLGPDLRLLLAAVGIRDVGIAAYVGAGQAALALDLPVRPAVPVGAAVAHITHRGDRALVELLSDR
jgi:hypothetical protein